MHILNSLPMASVLALVLASPVVAADIPLGTAVEADEVLTTVVSVDTKERRVVVKDAAGEPITIQVTDAARDLHNLKAGDYVAVLVTHSAAFDLDTQVQSQAPGGFEEEGVALANPNNPQPGGDAFRMARVQLKIVGINGRKHELTFEGPDGGTKVISVDDPKLRGKLSGLRVGQTLNVTFEDSLQIVTAHPNAMASE